MHIVINDRKHILVLMFQNNVQLIVIHIIFSFLFVDASSYNECLLCQFKLKGTQKSPNIVREVQKDSRSPQQTA